MIRDDELREWIGAAQDDVTGVLAPNREAGAHECVNAVAARHARQLLQTATTIVSKRSGGTGI